MASEMKPTAAPLSPSLTSFVLPSTGLGVLPTSAHPVGLSDTPDTDDKPIPLLPLNFYEAMLQLNPNNAQGWFELGLVLLRQLDDVETESPAKATASVHGHLYDARECFEMCVKALPEHSKGWFMLGIALHRSGPKATTRFREQTLDVQDCFENSCLLNPSLAQVWFNIGMCMIAADKGVSTGTRTTSRRLITVVEDVAPNDSKRRNSAVDDDRMPLKRVATKQDCFTECLRRDSQHAQAWFHLGLSLPVGRDSDAIDGVAYSTLACFEAAVRISVKDAVYWYHLGCALSTDGSTGPIATASRGARCFTKQQCFEVALRLNMTYGEAWYNLGTVLLHRGVEASHAIRDGRRFSVQECFEEAARYLPLQYAVWYNLGLSMRDDGDVTTVIHKKQYTKQQCFEVCLRLNAAFSPAWAELGITLRPGKYSSDIHGDKKRFSKQKCFERALELDSSDARSWYHLGTTIAPPHAGERSVPGSRAVSPDTGNSEGESMGGRGGGGRRSARTPTPATGSSDIRVPKSHEVQGRRYSRQQCFEQALVLDAHMAEAWNDLGVTMTQLHTLLQKIRGAGALAAAGGMWRETVLSAEIGGKRWSRQEAFEEALRLDENLARTWYNLAMCLEPVMPRGADRADGESEVARPLALSGDIDGRRYARRACLERSLVLDDENAEAWYQLGITLPDALQTSATALDVAPAVIPLGGRAVSPGSMSETAALYSIIHRKRWGKHQCLERALSLGSLELPNEAEAWNRLGVALAAAGRDAAFVSRGEEVTRYSRQECFEMSLRLDPQQGGEAWFNLGCSLPTGGKTNVIMGKTFTEKECFEEALLQQPHHPPAWYNLGVSLPDLVTLSRPIEGVSRTKQECFERSLALFDGDADAWNQLGLCLFIVGSEGAAESPRSTVRSDALFSTAADDEATWEDGRGFVPPHEKRKRRREQSTKQSWSAQECFEKSLHLAVLRHADAWVNLGTILCRRNLKEVSNEIHGRQYRPSECFEAALLYQPKCASAWFGLGTALPRGGRSEDIGGRAFNERECFEQVVRLEPMHAEGWLNLGLLLSSPIVRAREALTAKRPGSNRRRHRTRGSGGADASSLSQSGESGDETDEEIVDTTNVIDDIVYNRRECFEQAIRCHRRLARAWFELGRELLPSDTSPVLDDDDASSPRKAATPTEPWFTVAAVSGGSGGAPCRQRAFEEALRLDPLDGQAWCELGKCLPDDGAWSGDIGGRMFSKKDCFEEALRLQFDGNVYL